MFFLMSYQASTVAYHRTSNRRDPARAGGDGRVILIGRGGNVVTARLPDVLHVRLVAPFEKRVEHAHQYYHMTKAEAQKFCLREDHGRARYLKKYFNADIDDPLLYHLIINTGQMDYHAAAKLIGEAVLNPDGRTATSAEWK